MYDPKRDRVLNCTFTLGKDIIHKLIDDQGNKAVILDNNIFLFGNNLFLKQIDFEDSLYNFMNKQGKDYMIFLLLTDESYTSTEIENIKKLSQEVKIFTVKGSVVTIGYGMHETRPKNYIVLNHTIWKSGYASKIGNCNFFYIFTLVNRVEFLITFITPSFISKDLTESVLENFRELLIESGRMDRPFHFKKGNMWMDLNPFHTPSYFNLYHEVVGENFLIQKFLSLDEKFMGAITDDMNLIINFTAIRYH